MKPNEKALDLVSKFKEYVHGYVGSSMLTNYEYPGQVLSQAKKAATIVVDEILNQYESGNFNYKILDEEELKYWEDVKAEIEKL